MTIKHCDFHLTFLGAAEEVTGSCHLLQTPNAKYLLDCGMHQGGSATERFAIERFDFTPSEISAVFLSHAHLDHSGMLPRLVHEGFRGTIYCTPATHELLKILLKDSLGLYLRDLEYKNTRLARAGKPPITPIYNENDVERVLACCQRVKYGELHQVSDDIQLRFDNAGHILGSSVVSLELGCGENKKVLVFSGDLGNEDAALMRDPSTGMRHADVILMEGTYGNRNHCDMDATIAEFRDIIKNVQEKGGNILIPSFAIGRTQELLFQLGVMYQEGLLQGCKVFLDSPMAQAVTAVYNRFAAQWDEEDSLMLRQAQSRTLQDFLPILNCTESVEESMALNKISNGAIIIAGSGMCTGGRIRHHFKHRLWKQNTHVVFVGFQARGTLGRILVDGVKHIKLFGQEINVKAQIHTLGGFSAHADQQHLLEWATCFNNSPKFMLVHGEREALVALSKALWDEKGIDSTVAIKGSSIHF